MWHKLCLVKHPYLSSCFRLTSTEAYFVSEALYCPPEELDDSRKITLQVTTLGKHLASSEKVNTAIYFILPFYWKDTLELPVKETSPKRRVWLCL